MKLRFVYAGHLIDLGRIAGLAGIEERGADIRCGAMTRHGDIERSSLLAERIPLLHEVAGEIADVQVRNRGTLGGSLCMADPAADWAVASLALGARLRCVSRRGDRLIDAAEFFRDAYTTAMAPGEILADIFFPVPPAGSVGTYVKIRKRSGDFAIASVALQVVADALGRCEWIGLGVGGGAATPIAPRDVTAFLKGKVLDGPVIDEACAILARSLDPIEDLRGSADYKRSIACVALERAAQRAVEEARRRGAVPR
jgi:carbon-monoxide dehydrogenase medium subunit